jgi:hypothetical protein
MDTLFSSQVVKIRDKIPNRIGKNSPLSSKTLSLEEREIMVKNGEFYMIHEMRKRGMSITRIAQEMGRD